MSKSLSFQQQNENITLKEVFKALPFIVLEA